MVALSDVLGAIGLSSVNVLVYYALANASALKLCPEERHWPLGLSVLGLVG